MDALDPSLADQLRRSFSGVPVACTCPLDVAESLRRVVADRNAAVAPTANANIAMGDDAALLVLLGARGIAQLTELCK